MTSAPTDNVDAATGIALIRRPGPRLAEGIVSHIKRSQVDVDLAGDQWLAYVAALEQAGWSTYEVEAADDLPDSVFIEDTMVVFKDLAVMARLGSPLRRSEVQTAEEAIRAHNYRYARIDAPGTLDGGDVLKIGSAVYVGLGGRTNAAGIAQLTRHLEPLGAAVIAIPVTKVLHLKSAVTALPDGTVIGYPPLVDEPEKFERFRPVREAAGAHVVLLDNARLLMAASAPRTAESFADLGYEPVLVDISEFEKLEGCVTCLSVRLRG
ncbi:MAG: dimethylargininase [Nocardioidaceae bacterium]